MAKVVYIQTVTENKRIQLEAKLELLNSEIKSVEEKNNQLCEQRRVLERELYTPNKCALLNIARRAEKLDW